MRFLLRTALVASAIAATPLLAQQPASAAAAPASADTARSDDWGTAPVGRYLLVAEVGPRQEKALVTIEQKEGKLVGTLQPNGDPGAPLLPLHSVTPKGRELLVVIRQGNGGMMSVVLRKQGEKILGWWENSEGNSGAVEGSVVR